MKPGTLLGTCEIIALIGKGGMGEVYRARDTKLQRDVAIKVLPALFARDPERLARFEREARTLAALNHPNVAHIYGIVELPDDAGGHGLVMEFVDGEDLAERIARGAVPLDDALPIALQIAQALEAAHEHGIVHRDLKPANVKLRGDGQVKVLDFGLAKALGPADPSAAAPNLENSPTITSPFQMSQFGVILGTAAYMAPEQAKGKPIDKRADIWAFGCVLYEMLTGTRPFGGEDVTDTLAAIVRADPDWSALPADTPPHIRTLLRRCLEKDRRERLPDIGAARLELKEAAPHPALPAVARARQSPPQLLPWMLFALATLVAIGAVLYALRPRVEPESRVVKSTVMPPAPLSSAPALRFNVSPDGRRIAFVSTNAQSRSVVWVRALDSLIAQPIAGTLDAQAPFWSADSRWIAFFADGKLKKVDPATGAVISICDAGAAPPGTWNRDDVILFTRTQVIARVPATGGTPEDVTTIHPGEQTHISPFFLPDGRHFLYTVSGAGATRPGVFVASLDKGEPKRILDFASNTFYASGHLLFLRDGTLMAQRFDPESAALSGTAVPLAEGLQMNPNTGSAAFSASANGVLVYQTGVSAGTQLMWFDRSGRPLARVGEQRGYRDVQLSPDGRRASVTIIGPRSPIGDVWLLDLERNQRQRFTFDESTDAAVWAPDGRSLVFRRSGRDATRSISRMAATGSGTEERLVTADVDMIPLGFSPDGTSVLYRLAGGAATGPLFVVPLTGERKPRSLLDGDRAVSAAAISPDGKWLAYASGWSGRRDVYVTSFPDGVGKWQISSDGGENPVWRGDGKELFFFASDRLLAVDVNPSTDRFDAGPERMLFAVHVPSATLGTRSTYAATRDGQKFLVNTWDAGSVVDPMTLVVNWPATIK